MSRPGRWNKLLNSPLSCNVMIQMLPLTLKKTGLLSADETLHDVTGPLQAQDGPIREQQNLQPRSLAPFSASTGVPPRLSSVTSASHPRHPAYSTQFRDESPVSEAHFES